MTELLWLDDELTLEEPEVLSRKRESHSLPHYQFTVPETKLLEVRRTRKNWMPTFAINIREYNNPQLRIVQDWSAYREENKKLPENCHAPYEVQLTLTCTGHSPEYFPRIEVSYIDPLVTERRWIGFLENREL